MKLYQYTDQDLTMLANQVKETVIQGLLDEGIAVGKIEQLCGSYAVLVTPPTTLGRLWKKARGIKEDNPCIFFVRDTDPRRRGDANDSE